MDFQTAVEKHGVLNAAQATMQLYSGQQAECKVHPAVETAFYLTYRLADGTLIVLEDDALHMNDASQVRLYYYAYNDDTVVHVARGIEQIFDIITELARDDATWDGVVAHCSLNA